jgi:acyl-CoA dehydrogenase
MASNVSTLETTTPETSWIDKAQTLAQSFGQRAADHDRDGTFVADNFADLRASRFFSASIPTDLGGGGASFADLAGIIREIGKHCGSTALTFAMHSHTIGANVYKHIRGDEAATRSLEKIVAGELIISTTGANDWLQSSGKAERVDGGYRINARKHFVSGSPGADILATSATTEENGFAEVLHFAIPRHSDGIEIVETWDTLGMRGTGSHDVVYHNVFIPDAAVAARRPAGQWHPMWEVILPTAMPLISSAYVGLAESAVCLAVESARRKGADLTGVTGEMLNTLTVASLALGDMIRLNDNHQFQPSVELVDNILTRKSIVAESVKETVEIAAELVGGPGFYRGHAMERIVRDIRALHYHPLPQRRQQIFSGRIALGMDAIEPTG